ncbi:MAG TPA: M23 family metallopeptidase [Candidatus Saccharimonadales bacterium]|nr:M23 family metallopeptidase [Candidatus Saccharimonadales bacterium]
MLFTIKRPRSERFFQLGFKGFRPGGRNKIEYAINVISAFFTFLYKYFFKRIVVAVSLFGKAFPFIKKIFTNFKAFVVRKLIWSRGRLGRPIATFVVMTVAFFVFIFGEVLNSSKFVNSQEISPDYLSNVSDIIPERNVALTTIPENRKRDVAITYTVLGGDTLSGIGSKFRISTDALKYVNNLSDTDYLKPGQQITIPPVAGLIHKVSSGDTLQSIATKYDVPAQAIADFNYILDTSKIAVGTELVIPGAKVPAPVIIPVVAAQYAISPVVDTSPSNGWCGWPTTVRIITQYFSWYHNGVDIATPAGYLPPIFACAGGTVIRAGWDPWGLGLHVRIQHPNGYVTIYGHMSRLLVQYGEKVGKGEQIGVMGSTGHSTGPHVHFMVEYKGVPQNPLDYIR